MRAPDRPSDSDRPPVVDDPEQVVVRDRRRLDPETGELRARPDEAGPAPSAAPDRPTAPDHSAPLDQADGAGQDRPDAPSEAPDPVAELTADLQRVTAEYANYRKRVERDRIAVVEMATAGLLSGLLPVLDDIERARAHGDVHGAFKGVADGLEALTTKLGLERFGDPGEPFDPAVHEALMQAEPDPTSPVATCAAVLQPGYRLASSSVGGTRVLRPARVSVAEPGAERPPTPEPQQPEPQQPEPQQPEPQQPEPQQPEPQQPEPQQPETPQG